MRTATRRLGLAACAAMLVMGTTGCGLFEGSEPNADTNTDSSSGTTTVAETTTTQPAPQPKVDEARLLAAQYDYDAALDRLKGETTTEAEAEVRKITEAKAAAVLWKDNTQVSHIFYHSLVIDPKRAFAPTEPQRQGYLDYMVTAHEFRLQLKQLHERGYVLVLPRHLMAKQDGEMKPVPLHLPPGKKPLILSIDDVSYYEYMEGDGFATKLILDEDGKVTNTYTDAEGKETTGAYDVSTVLDEFVEKHPDFSYRGDKGIFALTGYNGILGYRTSEREYGSGENTKQAQAEATKVAKALKESGWEFASHSWGHINMSSSSLGRIQNDAQLWDDEVRPLLGEVDQIIFAFGGDISGVTPYSLNNAKFVELHQNRGFDYIFPIDGSVAHWGQVSSGTWRNARINIDGITLGRALANPNHVLHTFFDVQSVVDPARQTG